MHPEVTGFIYRLSLTEETHSFPTSYQCA